MYARSQLNFSAASILSQLIVSNKSFLMYDKTVLFSWPPITQHFFVFEAVEFECKRKKLLDDLANIWFGKLKDNSQINNFNITIIIVFI